MNELHRHEDIPIHILVGNKVDLADERTVSKQEGKDLARQYGIPYVEASAKTNEGIDKLFGKVAKGILTSDAV